MANLTCTWTVGEFVFDILVEDTGGGRITYPGFRTLPKPGPDSIFYSHYANSDTGPVINSSVFKQGFLDDISAMLPTTVSSNILNDIEGNFLDLIKVHLRKYGRLLEPDLVMYIEEMVLLIQAVYKAMQGRIFAEAEGRELFSDYFRKCSTVFLK